MNAKVFGIALLAIGVLSPGAADASHFGMEVVNPVDDAIFGIPATPPGNVVERFFPSEVVPNHRKRLAFSASFETRLATDPTSVTIWLTWIDPRFPEQPQVSAPTTFEMLAASQRQIVVTMVIPFTPPQVGVHVQNHGPGEPLQFNGRIVHRTVPIPEPDTIALVFTAAAGFAAAARRRRRQYERCAS